MNESNSRTVASETMAAEPDILSAIETLGALLPVAAPPAIHAALGFVRAWVEEAYAGFAEGSAESADGSATLTVEDPDPSVQADLSVRVDGDVIPLPAPILMQDPLQAFGDYTTGWDERQCAIAVARMFVLDRVALEPLGDRFGVTRERIRQIQSRLETSIQDWLATDDERGRPFLEHLLAIQHRLGTVATESDLRALHPDHEQPVPSLGVPLWQPLAVLLPDRVWTEGWVIAGGADEMIARTRSTLREYCAETLPTWEQALELGSLGIRESAAQQWLDRVGGGAAPPRRQRHRPAGFAGHLGLSRGERLELPHSVGELW